MNQPITDHPQNPESPPARSTPVEPRPSDRPSRRNRTAAALYGATLLSTTALAVPLETKLPPYHGD
jgi:hypothetical protein